MTYAQAVKLRRLIEEAVRSLTDEKALECVTLFVPWQTGIQYAENDRVKHNDVLHRCVQAHTSQADWTPDITPALWTVVSLDEWPEWHQPAGAHDAYPLGAKVSHNGKHWTSDIDANIYEPGVACWTEVFA